MMTIPPNRPHDWDFICIVNEGFEQVHDAESIAADILHEEGGIITSHEPFTQDEPEAGSTVREFLAQGYEIVEETEERTVMRRRNPKLL